MPSWKLSGSSRSAKLLRPGSTLEKKGINVRDSMQRSYHQKLWGNVRLYHHPQKLHKVYPVLPIFTCISNLYIYKSPMRSPLRELFRYYHYNLDLSRIYISGIQIRTLPCIYNEVSVNEGSPSTSANTTALFLSYRLRDHRLIMASITLDKEVQFRIGTSRYIALDQYEVRTQFLFLCRG